ncbi:MAG: hypothetical protein J0H09_05525 [Burkholderiales bacterium]|nr:hypothetical protein [Burkholderiales bacterium]
MRFKRTVAARRWTSPLAAYLSFGLLCGTLAYWFLQLTTPPVAIAPAGSIVDYGNAPDLGPAAQLFGQHSGAAQAAAPSNIQVLGVAASAQRASAVLTVDGGPPRAYMIGDELSQGIRLVAVRPDAAVIEQNGARIELVAPQRPSLSILSGGGQRNDPANQNLNAPVSVAPGPPGAAPGAFAPGTPPAASMSPPPAPPAATANAVPPPQMPQGATDPATGAPLPAPGTAIGEQPPQFRR